MSKMPPILSFRPSTYRLRAKLQRPRKDFRLAAVERLEIAAATTVQSFDALCLPNEEGRATGTMAGSQLEQERANARRNIGKHGATIAYRFEDALIADATWYSGGVFENLRPQKRKAWIFDDASHFEEAQLCTEMGSELYFGHWLCDALCTELLASDRNLPGLCIAGSNRLHESGIEICSVCPPTQFRLRAFGRYGSLMTVATTLIELSAC
jgi:hypothetical protein